MKILSHTLTARLPLLAALALACALPSPAFAAKTGKKALKGEKGTKAEKVASRPGKVLKTYDTNGNHVIDGTEVDAVKKAYEDDKTGPLKQFDANNDGKLDDTEIAAIKPKHGKGAKGEKDAAATKGAKKKKKNDA